MLVLSRTKGQQIVLPECDVRITVLRIKGNRVQLGISAPASIAVLRAEITATTRDTSRPVADPEGPAASSPRPTMNTKDSSTDAQPTAEPTSRRAGPVLIASQ